MSVKFTDNSSAVRATAERAKGRALEMLGLKWQEIAAMEISAQPRFGGAPGVGAVDTGLMRGSNVHEVDLRNSQVVVGNSQRYALYVTYGTWKMPARPWFQNTVDSRYIADYRNVVKQAYSGS